MWVCSIVSFIFVRFAALVKNDTVFLKRTFPQWDLQLYFPRKGHGMLYFYCTRDVFFAKKYEFFKRRYFAVFLL